MQILEHVKDSEGKSSLESVDQSKVLNWETPIVLCMGGVETTTEKAASGFARVAGRLLGDEKEVQGVRLLTAIYPKQILAHKEAIFNLTNIASETPDHPRVRHAMDVSAEIIENMFKPHIDEVFAFSDKPAEQLAKDFSKLTLFTHSFGSRITPCMHDELKALLKEKGLKNKEVSDVLRHIHVLSFGDVGVWHAQPKEGWGFTSLHMASTKDIKMYDAIGERPPTEKLITLKDKPNIGVVINSLEPQLSVRALASDPIRASHHVFTYARPRDARAGDFDGESAEAVKGNIFAPTMLAHVLHNMVSRDSASTPSIVEMMQPAKSAPVPDYYKDRLEMAGMTPEETKGIVELDAWPDDWKLAGEGKNSAEQWAL